MLLDEMLLFCNVGNKISSVSRCSEQSLAFVVIFLPLILLAFVSACCRRKRVPTKPPCPPVPTGQDEGIVDPEMEDSKESPPNMDSNSGARGRRLSPQPDVMTSQSLHTNSDTSEGDLAEN